MKTFWWNVAFVVFVVFVVTGTLVGVFITSKRVNAQSPQEVAPYKVADLPNGFEVYKLVHQGCEIFVSTRYVSQVSKADSAAVSIATGRNCK